MRPLAEIANPWLDRDGLEASIWRVTGTKSIGVVNELLKIADVYAASQGPRLADEVLRRRQERGRFERMVSTQIATTRSLPLRPVRIQPERRYIDHVSRGRKSAPTWEQDGIMYQECTKCGVGKPYDQFHNDKGRWNGKASQCRSCKNPSRAKENHEPQAEHS